MWGRHSDTIQIPMVPHDYWTNLCIQQYCMQNTCELARMKVHPQHMHWVVCHWWPKIQASSSHQNRKIQNTQIYKDIISSEDSIPVAWMNEINAVRALNKADYIAADLSTIVCNTCIHLFAAQQEKLLFTLNQFSIFFGGRCEKWTGREVSITLMSDTKTVQNCPYSIPLKNRQVVEEEMYCQCDIGAMRLLMVEEAKMKQYFIPPLGISKKDGSIKLVIDFQTHTELIERRVYSLFRIE